MSYIRLLNLERDVDTSMCALFHSRARSCSSASMGYSYDWWKRTTNYAYLHSPMSHRVIAWPMLCFAGFVTLALDYCSLDSFGRIFVVDIIQLMVFALAGFIPRESLWLEVLTGCAFGAYTSSMYFLRPLVSPDFNCLCVSFLLASVPLHATAVVCFILFEAVFLICIGAYQGLILLIASGFCTLTLRAYIDDKDSFTVLSSISKQAVIEQLLEHATDGFCDIDIETGTFISASSKLHQRLESTVPLQGRRFLDLVHVLGDKVSLQESLDAAANEKSVRPTLVTFSTFQDTVLDVKCIPYHVFPGHLSICVQVVGEARTEHDHRHEAAIKNATKQGAHEDFSDVSAVFPNLRLHASDLTSLAYSKSVASEVGVIHMISTATQTESLSLMKKPPRAPSSVKKKICLGTHRRLMKRFKETPTTSVTWLVSKVIRSANIRGKGCCNFHVSLTALLHHVSSMVGQGCKPFVMNCAWQCEECFVLHAEDSDEEMCSLCGCEHHQIHASESLRSHTSSGEADVESNNG